MRPDSGEGGKPVYGVVEPFYEEPSVVCRVAGDVVADGLEVFDRLKRPADGGHPRSRRLASSWEMV